MTILLVFLATGILLFLVMVLCLGRAAGLAEEERVGMEGDDRAGGRRAFSDHSETLRR